MTTLLPVTEGEVSFDVPEAGKPSTTFYKVLGEIGSGPTLIALHGGPGAGHEYLAPLGDLWESYGISTVLYDQIGCGRSSHFRDKIYDEEFWVRNLEPPHSFCFLFITFPQQKPIHRNDTY